MMGQTGTVRIHYDINGLVQERRNSIANALELRLSCTKPSIRLIFSKKIHSRYSHTSSLRVRYGVSCEFEI